jgi:hypothetical protein
LVEKIGKPVHGILYPSSRRAGGVGCVLFFSNEDLKHDGIFGPAVKAPFALIVNRTETIDVDTGPA